MPTEISPFFGYMWYNLVVYLVEFIVLIYPFKIYIFSLRKFLDRSKIVWDKLNCCEYFINIFFRFEYLEKLFILPFILWTRFIIFLEFVVIQLHNIYNKYDEGIRLETYAIKIWDNSTYIKMKIWKWYFIEFIFHFC